MFKKIVSKLPFNPSLLSNLSDYDHMLKNELRLRAIGILVLILIIITQLIAIILPPVSKNLYSPNNLVGVSNGNPAKLYSLCINNTSDYRLIVNFYKISCEEIGSSSVINLAVHSATDSLYSLNRLPYGAEGEKNISIANNNLYIRKLSFGWELKTNDIKVLKIRIPGVYIAINSGNIISSQGFLTAGYNQQTCSTFSRIDCFSNYISARDITSGKTDVNNSTVSAGDIIAYTILAKNISSQKISSLRLSVNFSNALAYSTLIDTYGGSFRNGIVSYTVKNMASNQSISEEITFKIDPSSFRNPVSSSDPNYDNGKMITTFGNTITINAPKSFLSYYELSINNYLPSVSAGSTIIILVITFSIYLYFILRTVLLREEIKLIKKNH